jgi:hypothetical protein
MARTVVCTLVVSAVLCSAFPDPGSMRNTPTPRITSSSPRSISSGRTGRRPYLRERGSPYWRGTLPDRAPSP